MNFQFTSGPRGRGETHTRLTWRSRFTMHVLLTIAGGFGPERSGNRGIRSVDQPALVVPTGRAFRAPVNLCR